VAGVLHKPPIPPPRLELDSNNARSVDDSQIDRESSDYFIPLKQGSGSRSISKVNPNYRLSEAPTVLDSLARPGKSNDGDEEDNEDEIPMPSLNTSHPRSVEEMNRYDDDDNLVIPNNLKSNRFSEAPTIISMSRQKNITDENEEDEDDENNSINHLQLIPETPQTASTEPLFSSSGTPTTHFFPGAPPSVSLPVPQPPPPPHQSPLSHPPRVSSNSSNASPGLSGPIQLETINRSNDDSLGRYLHPHSQNSSMNSPRTPVASSPAAPTSLPPTSDVKPDTSLLETLEQSQKTLKENEQEITSLHEKIRDLESLSTSTTQALQNTQKQLDEQQDEIHDLRNQIDDYESHKTESEDLRLVLESELSRLHESHESLFVRMQEVEQERDRLVDEAQDGKSEREERLLEEVEVLRGRLRETEDALDAAVEMADTVSARLGGMMGMDAGGSSESKTMREELGTLKRLAVVHVPEGLVRRGEGEGHGLMGSLVEAEEALKESRRELAVMKAGKEEVEQRVERLLVLVDDSCTVEEMLRRQFIKMKTEYVERIRELMQHESEYEMSLKYSQEVMYL
jgi:archaellum component FlaC